MKNSFKILVMSLLFFTLKLPSLHANYSVDAKMGETFYTLFSLYYENDEHKAANYRKGTFLPINTTVTFIKANRWRIIVSVYGKEISFLNDPKYTGESIQGIFNRTFGRFPVCLDQFSELEKQNIYAGNVTTGMSKEAVILSLGYPPNHKTPSLLLPQWRYWRSKFGTFLIFFSNDRVSGTKGLPCDNKAWPQCQYSSNREIGSSMTPYTDLGALL